MASSNNNTGLSLLGTLLAALILASTAVAASQLVARTQRSTQVSRELVIVTVLGREGIELVRAWRDTNWFLKVSDGRHWTQGLCEKSEFTLDPNLVRRLNPVGDSALSQLHLADNGEWIHETTNHPTPYQRLLSVDCREKDTSILVTSTITWRGADQKDHEWKVSERLYDWFL